MDEIFYLYPVGFDLTLHEADDVDSITFELYSPIFGGGGSMREASAIASLSSLASTCLSTVNSSMISLSSLTSTGLNSANSSTISLSSLTSTGLSTANSKLASLSSLLSTGGGSGGGLSLPIGTIISYPALKGTTPAGCLALSQTNPTVVNTDEYPELIGMYSGGNVQVSIDGSLATTDSPVLNGWTPSRLFDGTSTTEYHSTNITTPRIITVPIGTTSRTISRVEYQQRSVGGQVPMQIQLQLSVDGGSNYTNIGAPVTLGVAANLIATYDIPTASRVTGVTIARLVINAAGYAVIGEVRFYEDAMGSVVIPAQPMNAGQAPFVYIGR